MRTPIAATVFLTALLACNEGSVTSVDEATAVVSGTAYLDRDDDGAFGTADDPVAGAQASLIVIATGDTVARAQTAANGTFVLDRIAAGTYRLEVDLGSMSDSLEVVTAGGPIVLARGETVEAEVRVGYAATPATVAEARAMQAGDRVIVSGVALNASSAFGDSTLHLSDATGSIRATRIRDAVAAGDGVRLIGTIGMVAGQPVLTSPTTVIELVGVGMPAPDSLSTADAATAVAGVLDAAHVVVSGAIAAVNTNAPGRVVLTIDDGSGPLLMELRQSAGFTSTSWEIGQTLRGRGVLVPAGSGDRWELLPRGTSDLGVAAGMTRCSAEGLARQYACRDVDLAAVVPVAELGGDAMAGLNDIWGWTDPMTGREYAIVGRTDGTAFVDISDPLDPVLVANLPKTPLSWSSTWRDMKVYRDHVYVVADGAGAHGMQVVDLTRLRQFAGTPLQLTPDAHYTNINSAHNIVINEESGFAYAVGAAAGGQTCGGGLHAIDIREPKSPQFAGCFADNLTGRFGTGYTHDAQCVMYTGPDQRYAGREICFGANETALSIADVTDKANPLALSRASYPNVAYSHQGWLTEDQRYLYMNDELDEGQGSLTRTLIWDVADLEDPMLIAEHLSTEASTDHNLYIRGNLMYQSNYMSGLRILDISDRDAPVEVGFFDTTPGGDNLPGFLGAWSNYPFFASGVIIVSSRAEGLFVLRKR